MAHESIEALSALTELGQIKLGETDLNGVLSRIAELARRGLPGAAEVSVTLVRDRRPYTAAYAGETALLLDEWQYEQDAGPCLEAAARQATVSVPDAATDGRWSGWAARAAAAGMGSVLSVGLPVLDDVTGALNVYGRAPEAFDEATVALAQTFVGYAAVAMVNAHRYDATATLAQHMQAAMASRAVIEQAKGIIMGRRRCGPDEAFAVLAKVSQSSNRKLRDVAAELVADVQRGP
ncbi:GAF and ANTAR domain-containing protein [Actinoplanes sp. KI2]|uniref:GAF and ANTAR domain-containing protein n=1 Tax=Actinoplanes sp. KI2 TaxID=2983315 RepID=UPI0021D57D8A|nr:GAF and ANTAR domain-containing protein [Actinoplanes sp. KI2]MCU7727987.1 GAF and ANTAR domain-containing protein [Actinoplanes sp. KI2]